MTQHSTETTVPLQVRDFVTRVRELLSDLDADEQRELLSGLEADLTDLVAERGPGALEDPAVYARELRTAAGHDPALARRTGRRGVGRATMEAIDGTHQSWNRVLDAFPGDLRGFLTALQPAWWLLRAGTAWLVVQDLRGPYIVLGGEWFIVLGIFVIVSVQLGRRAWGFDRLLAASALARLLLVALNVFAVTMVPGAVDRLAWHVAEERAHQFAPLGVGTDADDVNPDISYRGHQVCRLEVRDARDRLVRNAYVWDATGDLRLPTRTELC